MLKNACGKLVTNFSQLAGSAVTNKRLVYSLSLIWLAVTGSFQGWQASWLLAINGYLSAGILVWGGWQFGRKGAKPLTWPLVIFWCFGVLVSALSKDTASIARIFFWAILIAVYHLPHDLEALGRGARWAGWVIIPLAVIAPWENENSMAMLIWGLYWAGLGNRFSWPYTVLAGGALLSTHSEGGLLAMLAGGAIWAWLRWPAYRRWLAGGIIAGLGLSWLAMLAIKVGDVGSFWLRVWAYEYAWAGFTHSPIIGNGLNTYEVLISYWLAIDPHNLLLTILWETGLVGLAISLWLVYRLLALHDISGWVAAWLVTFLSHSMVDLPLFASFFTAVTLFMILGGLPCKEKITSAWPWLRPSSWPWPARRFPSRPR